MKKLLANLLIIALFVALFTGCTSKASVSPTDINSTEVNRSTVTPTAFEPTVTPIPSNTSTPNSTFTPKPENNKLIKFNLYDKDDCMTHWTKTAADWLKTAYELEIEYVIPRIVVDGVGTYTKDFVLLPTAEVTTNYTESLQLLFISAETSPDYMPSLYGTTTDCPAAKSLGKDYFVNLAPYIENGRMLQNYLSYIWGDNQEYFNNAIYALMDSAGAVYALPRREKRATDRFLTYNRSVFNKLSVSWDSQPNTWDEFIALLNKSKSIENIIPFAITEAKIENLLEFIASTYGLEFNINFDWTEKNGEPLWTYYWDDYLSILENARMMGEQHLTMNDTNNMNFIVNYNLDYNSKGRQFWTDESRWKKQCESGNAVTTYAPSSLISHYASFASVNDSKWEIASNWPTQSNREYSLIGDTLFSQSYIAIGNRIDKQRGDSEFTYRILDFLNTSMTDDMYFTYLFGREGIPFGDNVHYCGAWIWDVNPITGKKAIRFSIDDKFGFNSEESPLLKKYCLSSGKEPQYSRPDGLTDKEFWANIDSNYNVLIENANGNWNELFTDKSVPNYNDNSDTGVYVDYSQYSKYTLSKPLYLSTANYKLGTSMYGYATSDPMQFTVYWNVSEVMSSYQNIIDAHIAKNNETNNFIYKGFYHNASYLGSTEATSLQQKMNSIKSIAREFTIAFLSNEKQATDWVNYIIDLREAGYYDVYRFYCDLGTICKVTSYNENTISQSKVEEYRMGN